MIDFIASLSEEERELLTRAARAQTRIAARRAADQNDPADWIERNFWIPDLQTADDPTPRKGLLQLAPHLKTFLRFVFDPTRPLVDTFQTVIDSRIKKSSKTSLSAAVGRWIAEKKGPYSDVVFCANDREQAKGRAYEYATRSLQLDPRWDSRRGELVTGATNDLLWYTSQQGAFYQDGGKMRAIAKDYKGEAGANQNAAFFTEIAFFAEERARRLWDELRPPPTRWAIRWGEGYAGFLGEGELWRELWELFRDINDPEILMPGARRLTWQELEPYGGWIDWWGEPFYNVPGDPASGREDPPIWVNETARAVGMIDQGVAARRMPWQLGELGAAYYASLERTERREAIDRLDYNLWTSPVSEFIPIEWWDACKLHLEEETPDAAPAPDRRAPWRIDPQTQRPLIPPLDAHTPVVIGVDASVTGDCTAMVGVTRAPWAPHTEVVVRFCQVWTPPQQTRGGKKIGLDYHTTIERALRRAVANYNIVQVCYDPYQMHNLMTDLMRGRVTLDREQVSAIDPGDPSTWLRDNDGELEVWCYPFNQASERNRADKTLYDLIKDRRIWHPGFPDLTAHIRNCAAKTATNEDTKLRIVKKPGDGAPKIDAAVALAMAAYQTLHLNI
jgi:hypothetical protein